MTKEKDTPGKPATHFEQVPLKVVKKIAEPIPANPPPTRSPGRKTAKNAR